MVTCDVCQTDFVFPSRVACPKCGDGLEIRTYNEVLSGDLPTTMPVEHSVGHAPYPQREGVRPTRGEYLDEGARWLTILGLVLSCGLVVLCIFPEYGLTQLFNSLQIFEPIVRQIVKITLVVTGLIGAFRMVSSLITWKNGRHWYRRMRFPAH